MHAALLTPSKYIKAADFLGKDHTLTIEKIGMGELEREDNTTESKGIVRLVETKKLWVLNKTNVKALVALFGNETDDWIGKQITLYPEKNDQSPDGLAIRVRGSPHLSADLVFTLKLARKKPRKVKLLKTEPRKGTTAAPLPPKPAPAPAEEDDVDEPLENGLDASGELEPLADGQQL